MTALHGSWTGRAYTVTIVRGDRFTTAGSLPMPPHPSQQAAPEADGRSVPIAGLGGGGLRGGAFLYEYGRPAFRWAGTVEERVAAAVTTLVEKVGPPPAAERD